MFITVRKITNESLMRRACEMTIGKPSQVALHKMYEAEHSPIRTQMFWIEMQEIPTFVSVHFVRHNVGVQHFVKSNREDRGGDVEATRLTPVDHAMFVNAQALINMARKRLCKKASPETREVMGKIVERVEHVDPALAAFLVPECVYRGGVCHELRPCTE